MLEIQAEATKKRWDARRPNISEGLTHKCLWALTESRLTSALFEKLPKSRHNPHSKWIWCSLDWKPNRNMVDLRSMKWAGSSVRARRHVCPEPKSQPKTKNVWFHPKRLSWTFHVMLRVPEKDSKLVQLRQLSYWLKMGDIW